MSAHSRFKHLARAVSVAALVAATSAQAQIVPLVGEREVFALAGLEGIGSVASSSSTDEFMPFDDYVSKQLVTRGSCGEGEPDTCVVGSCEVYAGQISSIFGAGIEFSGEAWGGWSGTPIGMYEFRSICKFRFRLDVPVDYDILLAADPGDLPPGEVFASLEGPTPALTFHYTQFGVLQASGQLGPGEYVIQGRTSIGLSTAEFTSGGSYSGVFVVNPIDTLDTGGYPFDQNVACGGTATFTIGSFGTPGTLTYQWRRGLTPLVDDGHYAGATSPTLTINNACTSDEDYYSVVATVIGSNPPITIPSRFAHLTIVSTPTGVAVDDAAPARGPSFAAPSPNPFQTGTTLRYAVPPSTRVRAAVYDATGARVRNLADAVVSGAGSIAWDGRAQTGERAAAGVYFVHLEAGAARETKKVVLLK